MTVVISDYYSNQPSWPVDDNTRINDCTTAAIAHLIQIYTLFSTGTAVLLDISTVDAFYSLCSGWTGNNLSDIGCPMTTALANWKKVGIGGHFIDDYQAIDPANIGVVSAAVQQHCCVALVVALPTNIPDGADWVVSGSSATPPDTHAIPIVGFDGTWFYVVSKGALVRM